MVETKSFGQWLRHRRRELDLTQEELAGQVGCAPITIRKMEAEEMRPSKQLAELLGKCLGVQAEEREGFVHFARGGEPAEGIKVSVPKHNLPHAVSSFIGREQEIAEIRVLLSTTRLVTLTGAGGCGKTRLALEAARQALDEFPDGVWLASLAPLSQPELVLQTIASTLGVREVPPHPVLDALLGHLQSRKVLLILDNCEHLVEACAQAVEALLQACPQLRVLATSREALKIQGEAQYYVPRLSLPEQGKDPSPTSVGRSEAVRLFADRAAAQAGFRLNAANSMTVAEICRRLDGMPLAIELAAARVKILPPRRILAGLDDRFSMLVSGNRTAPPRHQTLRAAIDWSYDLLSEHGQRLLGRLSVFSGGFERQAAAAVCSDEVLSSAEVLSALSNLVDRSLVEVLPAGEDVRYGLPETIRMYAAEKLHGSGGESRVRDRHLAYFTDWAENAEPKLRGPGQILWWDRMEVEHDNLRAALQWSLLGAKAETGLRLANSAYWFWGSRGYLREALALFRELLSAVPTQLRQPARARGLLAAGELALVLSTPDASPDRYDESLQIWRELGDKWWTSFALDCLGWYWLYQRDSVRACSHFEEATALARETRDPWILAYSLKGFGAAAERTDYPAARPILEESIAIWRDLGVTDGLADALNQLGTVAHGEDQDGRAIELYEESLRLFRNAGATTNIQMVLTNLGAAVQGCGDNQRATQLFRESLQIARESDHQKGIADNLRGLGGVAGGKKQPKRAARLLGAAQSIYDAIGMDLAAWPYGKRDFARWDAGAHAGLDEAGFEAAYAEGRAMTADQAVQYALAEPPEALEERSGVAPS